MKPHESPRIRKKSIRGDSSDSWPVWNRGIRGIKAEKEAWFYSKVTVSSCATTPVIKYCP